MTAEQRKIYRFTQFYLNHFEAARLHHEGNPIILDGADTRADNDARSETDSDIYRDMPALEPNSPLYGHSSPGGEGPDDFYMAEGLEAVE